MFISANSAHYPNPISPPSSGSSAHSSDQSEEVTSAPPLVEEQAPNASDNRQQSSVDQMISKDNYGTTRDIKTYFGLLGKDFTSAIKTLKTGEKWLDSGCGQAVAMKGAQKSLAKRKQMPELWGVSMSDNPKQLIKKDREDPHFNYRNMPVQQLNEEGCSGFSVISDVVAALSYETRNPHEVLQKYIELLEPGGTAYIMLPNTFKNPSIAIDNGTFEDFGQWIEDIKGASGHVVPIDNRGGESTVEERFGYRITLQRTAVENDEISVPPLVLVPGSLQSGAPPKRSYSRETEVHIIRP